MRRALRHVHAGLLAAALAGCGVSAGDIEAWKGTPDGTGRLVEALRSPKVSSELRARAAVALLEAGAVDRMASAVAGMPIEERAQVIPAAAPLVAAHLDASDPGRAWDAREALFALRQQATTDEARRTIDAALFPALEKDLRAGRTAGGRHTLADILTALGPASVPTLQAVLEDAGAPFAPAYEVLDKVGDKAAKERSGDALARRARGASPIPAGLFGALGTLGGKEAIAVLEEAVARGDEQSEPAAEALALIRFEPALLPFALKTAGDPRARAAVRARMLEVIRNVGGEEARKGLVGLIAKEGDAAFRYELFKAALKAGGGAALLPGLEAFPPGGSYRVEDIQEHLVGPIYALGFENREGLFKALESRSPFARMAAVLTLEKSGFDSDAEHVEKLARDRGVVRGFPVGRTIGAEATRVAALLKKMAG